MYPSEDSILHRGLGMDRFVVAWHIRSEKAQNALAGRLSLDEQLAANAPVVNTMPGSEGQMQPVEEIADFPSETAIRVEIPPNIQEVKSQSPEAGRHWRSCTRQAFQWYLGRGYRVSGFYRDKTSQRCFYLLTRAGS
ncbi:MAG: hypothetical protein D6814_13050 [Calditrichaeota bacterium]|nr:MAG: hypothetical protein D6814_13050 [Calditrichota bacterium]